MHESEEVFADYLKQQGKTFIYHPKRFMLDGTTYQVDFYCFEDDVYYEVVGTRQAFSFIRHKIFEFKRLYPDINFKIVKPNGQKYNYRERRYRKFKEPKERLIIKLIDSKLDNIFIKKIAMMLKMSEKTIQSLMKEPETRDWIKKEIKKTFQ